MLAPLLLEGSRFVRAASLHPCGNKVLGPQAVMLGMGSPSKGLSALSGLDLSSVCVSSPSAKPSLVMVMRMLAAGHMLSVFSSAHPNSPEWRDQPLPHLGMRRGQQAVARLLLLESGSWCCFPSAPLSTGLSQGRLVLVQPSQGPLFGITAEFSPACAFPAHERLLSPRTGSNRDCSAQRVI